jgi:putative chitinase
MVDEGSCEWIVVPGSDDVNLQIQKGHPLQILRAYAADYNAFVEKLRDRDSACWTPGNSVGTSNHLSGTALDLNWDSHPFRVANAGYNRQMIDTMNELLDFYEDTVFWANNWESPKDAMHHQMGYDTFGAENAPRVQSFIDRKIRSDGFSTFRRGPLAAGTITVQAPDDGVRVLAEVMGNTVPDRYPALFPAVSQCLAECGCTTVDRIAMWVAQIGHESAGLRYMEEIASGAEYEGRSDLGNTHPGDGVRFKGRGPIQVTGRHNYTVLSQWAFDKGLVPSPTFFVDQPAQLASDRYGFMGVTWYWTTQRELNRASDDRNVLEATHMINGGEHGLSDRRSRYERALSLGGRLLSLLSGQGGGDGELSAEAERMIREIHAELFSPRASVSIYAVPGEGAKYRPFDLLSSVDAMRHEEDVETTAKRGNLPALDTIVKVANRQGARQDPYAVGRARRFIQELERERPEVLRAYIAAKADTA